MNPSLGMEVSEANAYSTVLFMQFDVFTALFTGDMEEEGLENVKQVLRNSRYDRTNGRDAEVGSNDSGYYSRTSVSFALPEQFTLLKVAHHGSRYTTDSEFLELTRPKLAIISCGRDNSYGHPHQELLDRLEDVGSIIHRTDQSGEISVIIKNGRIIVKEMCDNS